MLVPVSFGIVRTVSITDANIQSSDTIRRSISGAINTEIMNNITGSKYFTTPHTNL